MLGECGTSIFSCSSRESSFPVAFLLSAPAKREELLGSVEVEDSAGERVTGFVSLRE